MTRPGVFENYFLRLRFSCTVERVSYIGSDGSSVAWILKIMKSGMLWLFVWGVVLTACPSAWAFEHLILVGGPALRFNEKYKVNTHDRFWGNFVTAAERQTRNIKKNLPDGDLIAWLVYRPAYETRGKEEKQNLVEIVEGKAKALGVELVWFSNRDEFAAYFNASRRPEDKIAQFEYFGHSNKRCWMFDYSSELDGASMEPATFHIAHFSILRRDSLTPDAFCKSWGCHSGEEFVWAWLRYTMVSIMKM